MQRNCLITNDKSHTQNYTHYIFSNLTYCFNLYNITVFQLQIRVHRFDSGTRLQKLKNIVLTFTNPCGVYCGELVFIG